MARFADVDSRSQAPEQTQKKPAESSSAHHKFATSKIAPTTSPPVSHTVDSINAPAYPRPCSGQLFEFGTNRDSFAAGKLFVPERLFEVLREL